MTRLAALTRRHRLGHAVLFAITVCLLVATAAVDPLLSRSFSYGVVGSHAQAPDTVDNQVVISADSTAGSSAADQAAQVDPTRLERLLDPRVRAVVGAPVVSRYADTWWADRSVAVTVRSSPGQCAHLTLVQGRCPTATGEVLVSADTARVGAPTLRIGGTVTLATRKQHVEKLRVVGIYTVSVTDPFWRGVDIGRYDGPLAISAATLLVTQDTVERILPRSASISYPVKNAAVTPDSLAAAAAGARKMETSDQAYGTENLNNVYSDTVWDVYRAGRILPYLLVQLGVVLLILLVQVTTFFATVRRGEAAVLKMRGNGTAGVLRVGAGELLPSYVLGVVSGWGLAYLVDGFARHVWLPGHVAAGWSWTSVWLTLAAAGLVAVVWLVCWSQMAREPISSLLRARPQRRRGVRLPLVTAVIAVLCAGGVVLTATGSLRGAPVQVTPVLLAGLAAVIVRVLLAPAASWGVRRLLTGGSAGGSLAVAWLGRRAGIATALAVLIIASALMTFSVSVFSRGVDNRAARAAADLGAPALVHVTPGRKPASAQAFVAAVRSVDAGGREFSPAVLINQATPDANATLGVDPAALEKIGLRTGLRRAVPWEQISRGGWITVPNALIASWTTPGAVGDTVTAPTMADADGNFRVAGVAPYIPGVGTHTIVIDLSTMLRAGNRTDLVSFQVFSATTQAARLNVLRNALERAGFGGCTVRTVPQVRAGYDAAATAWAMDLGLVVSALSVFAALIGVVLVVVASQSDRQRDVHALLTGGAPHAVIRSATVWELMLLALMGSVIGALTAPVAARLTGGSMLWWSMPPEQPVTRTGFQWVTGSSAALGLAVLLVVVAAVCGLRLARSAARPAHHGKVGV